MDIEHFECVWFCVYICWHGGVRGDTGVGVGGDGGGGGDGGVVLLVGVVVVMVGGKGMFQ